MQILIESILSYRRDNMLRFKSMSENLNFINFLKVNTSLVTKSLQSNNIPRLSIRLNHIKSPAPKTNDDDPWYLKLGQDQRNLLKLQDIKVKDLIKFPQGLTPSSTLTNITNHMNDKLGLSNIIVFNMQNIDRTQFNGKIGDMMILSTALSMKHCHNSYIELNQYLKSKYDVLPSVEGRLNNHELKKLQRRLKRKNVKADSDSGFAINGSRYEINDAWYMIDSKIEGIIINILTEKKRFELNLEELYAPIDEKFKYQNNSTIESQSTTSSENNGDQSILAGLKRLANQRRNYSTSTLKNPTSSTNDPILNNIKLSIKNEEIDPQESLSILSKMIDTLNNTPIDKTNHINVLQWKQTLDFIWPLILPIESTLFWSKRFEFLTLLNMINPNKYQTSRFVKDFFLRKRLSNNQLNRKELIDFLKLNIIYLGINKGKGLLNVNEIILQVLLLYKDDNNGLNLANDSELINLLCQTLVTGHDTKLSSLNSMIDYILMETGNKPDTQIIIPMLRSLAQAKNWNEYFNLWANKLYSMEIGKDYRPWEQFIQYIVESDDQHLLYQLIEEGHLLWLIRYRVNITPGIKKQLTNLFQRLDPQGEHFKDLETLLLTTDEFL